MPDIGYPDFQRVVNWDSPVLYSGSVTDETTYVQSGALDVSRYGYMGGYMQCYVGYCTVTLEWFLDQAMTTIVGQREFTLDQHIANICQPKIVNMGPFLQVTFEAIGNAPFTADWSLNATNRPSALEFPPIVPYLINAQDIVIGASQAVFDYPASYYAGPIMIGVYNTAGPGSILLQQLSLQGTWDYFDQYNNFAGSAWLRFNSVVPAGAWRVEFSNAEAASSNYYLTVTPSNTGST